MSWRDGGVAIGITVGNAQARVAIFEAGGARLVPLEEGEQAMPSAVLLHRMREVGKYAYLYSGTDPHLLVTSINRLLGRSFDELSSEVRALSCEVRNDNNRARLLDWAGSLYAPIDLYAMVLRKLRQCAERYLGTSAPRAVIALPGSFDDYQRRSVRIAAEAVFSGVKLINEPAAAALAMNARAALPLNGNVMTVDIGAGKCEVAIITREQYGSVQHESAQHLLRTPVLRIKAIAGDTHLGGDDIDQLLVNYLARQFAREQGEEMFGESAMARHEVLLAVRAAKHQLTHAESAEVSVPFVNFDRYGRALHLHATITRALLAQLSDQWQQRISELIVRCRADAGAPTLTRVLMIGGSTALPFIAPLIARAAGQRPVPVENPAELAALGAAYFGAEQCGLTHGISVADVTAHSLGITTHSGDMGFILRRQELIPATVTKRFFTVEDNQREAHIEVREGEDGRARENRTIGEFWLPLPPRLPRHSPINVTIGKDEDGIVLVRAQALNNGTMREITITYDL